MRVTRFFIDETQGVVVAKIDRVWDEILRTIDRMDLNMYVGIGVFEEIGVPEEITGKASCDPRDKFDVRKGQSISAYRAKQKYHRQLRRVLEYIARKNKSDWSKIIDRYKKVEYCIDEGDRYTAEQTSNVFSTDTW